MKHTNTPDCDCIGCIAPMPKEIPYDEYRRTEHSISFKFSMFDGIVKPATFSNLGDLAQLMDCATPVQVIHQIREIRYQRHKFELCK